MGGWEGGEEASNEKTEKTGDEEGNGHDGKNNNRKRGTDGKGVGKATAGEEPTLAEGLPEFPMSSKGIG